MVLDITPCNDGGLVHKGGGGQQAEVVRLLDHRARGDLHVVCAESDCLSLLHTEQEHHYLGMLVLV